MTTGSFLDPHSASTAFSSSFASCFIHTGCMRRGCEWKMGGLRSRVGQPSGNDQCITAASTPLLFTPTLCTNGGPGGGYLSHMLLFRDTPASNRSGSFARPLLMPAHARTGWFIGRPGPFSSPVKDPSPRKPVSRPVAARLTPRTPMESSVGRPLLPVPLPAWPSNAAPAHDEARRLGESTSAIGGPKFVAL